MRKKRSIQQLVWVWIAYWRLWGARFRIKFKPANWLRSKIRFADHRGADQQVADGLKRNTEGLAEARAMHESVRLAARLHSRKTACLHRSIVLSQMLRHRNHDAQAVLGVNKKGAQLASHAWVEVGDIMIGEPETVVGDFVKITR